MTLTDKIVCSTLLLMGTFATVFLWAALTLFLMGD